MPLAGGKQMGSLKFNNWKRNELADGTSKWPCTMSSGNVRQRKTQGSNYVKLSIHKEGNDVKFVPSLLPALALECYKSYVTCDRSQTLLFK